jgi:holin-like protein
MKIFAQLALILALAYVGHLCAAVLSVPLPASVIGLLLLLIGLRTGWIPERRIDSAATFLTANMAFFFLPSAVEILGGLELVRPVLFRLLAVVVLGALVTFLATYGTVRVLQKWTARKESP